MGLLVGVWVGSARADAAVCTATSSGTWGPLEGGSVTWSCPAGAPQPDDRVRIPAGIRVRVVDDLVQGEASGSGIVVEPGGILVARVTAATGSLTLRLGPFGLACDGTCRFTGAYRTFAASPPGIEARFDVPTASWPVPAILPCADGDCESGAALVRFRYAATPKVEASLAAVAPGADVACFWDPEPDDLRASAEVNQCYEIADASTHGDPTLRLDLDVRQGRRDQAGQPFVRRRLRRVAITAPVAAGDREIAVSKTLLAGSEESGSYVGRWLRFAGAGGESSGIAYKILRTLDGGAGADLVQLGKVRGVADAHAVGEPAWVDYGYRTGDAFFVMAPVRIASATAAPGDSRIQLDGVARLRGVVFDDVRGVKSDGGNLQLEEYWLHDPTNLGSAAVQVVGTVDAVIRRGNQTGGSESPTEDVTHGLVVHSNTNLVVSDLSIRYHGDDAIAMGGSASNGRIERVHVAMRSDFARSCNCINHTGPHQIETRDVVCDDATDNDGNFQMAIDVGGNAFLDGVMVWGGEGVTVNNAASSRVVFEDLAVLGVDATVGWPLIPQFTERFVVRDAVQHLGNARSDVCLANATRPWRFADGIVIDTLVGSPAFCLLEDGSAGTLENVVFVNADSSHPSCPGGGSDCNAVTVVSATTPGTEIRDVSLVWLAGVTTRLSRGLAVLAAPAEGSLVIDGLLVSGFRGTGDDHALATVSASEIFTGGVHGPCFGDNDDDGNDDFDAAAPPTTVSGPPLGFVDAAGYRVDTLPGSVADVAGCGIRRGVAAPGVRYRWMHAVSKIAPERMADDADGDGVPDDPQAPRCAHLQSAFCSDTCPSVFDPAQRDADGDGLGDVCDTACANGADDDGDGEVDLEDPGCEGPADASERDSALPCDDGIDNDGDHRIDEDDPACPSPYYLLEDPECDDGIDNDGDLTVDLADVQCRGGAWMLSERRPSPCGLGWELALLLPALRRWRR